MTGVMEYFLQYCPGRMHSSLVYAAMVIAAAGVFHSIAGGKISFGVRSVRYKEEKLESEKTKKTSRQRAMIVTGALFCCIIAYAVTGVWYYAVIGLSGGYLVPAWYKKRREEQKKQLLRSQFIDVLGQIESAVYGGLNPYQAIEDIVPDMPRPARDVFYTVMRRYRTGDTMTQAIEAARIETEWDDLRILSVAMSLYSRIGCDLGEVCRYAAEAAEEKESNRSMIGAAIAQNIMTAKVLTVLPFFVVAIANWITPAFTRPLFGTLAGNIVFISASSWILVGNYFIAGIVKKTMGRDD